MDPGQLWRVLNGAQGANGVIVRILRIYPEYANALAAALAAPERDPEAMAV